MKLHLHESYELLPSSIMSHIRGLDPTTNGFGPLFKTSVLDKISSEVAADNLSTCFVITSSPCDKFRPNSPLSRGKEYIIYYLFFLLRT